MNWWDLIREAGDTFLIQHGVLASFVYLALEEGGIPIPVPGDFLMLALGARAREGSIVLWQVIAAMEAGTVLGSSILYLLARRGGRGIVERYGPFIGIGAAQLDRAERQLQRHGALAVVLGRLLPGLRVSDGNWLRDLPCPLSRVPAGHEPGQPHLHRRLHDAWLLCWSSGSRAVRSVTSADRAAWLGRSAAALVGWAGPGSARAAESAAAASVTDLAAAQSGAGRRPAGQSRRPVDPDLMVVVAGDLAWRLPDSLPAVVAAQLAQALTRDATGGLLWLAMPVIAGVAWGGVYAVWAERRLPGRDGVRGLLFAFVPYLVSGGLLAPLLVQVTDAMRVAPVALFAEAVRQAFFGLILGLGYPVLRARHPSNRVLEPLADKRSEAWPAGATSASD